MHMILKSLLLDKRSRGSVITAALSLLLLISVVISSFQVSAWFKSHYTVSTPASVTTFEDSVQYYLGNTLTAVSSDQGIACNLSSTSAGVTADSVKIRITHRAKSTAYVRFALIGSFRNADTGTYLPQSDDLWTISGSSDWVKNGSYYYYNKKIDNYDPSKEIADQTETVVLPEFTVSVDVSELSEQISPHQDYIGEFYILVESVQPDRALTLWELSSLPF